MRRIVGLLSFSLFWTGCAATTPPAPVPVSGAPADVSLLAGEWEGEYHGDSRGRSGVITFRLAAGADTASGDVIMFANEGRTTVGSGDTRNTGPTAFPQGLTIRFVRAAQGQVNGALDPYRDPECNCTVTTTFEGRLRGDVIEGRYVTARSGADALHGTWKVTRKKP